MQPVFRSSLTAIHVIAIAKTSDLRNNGCESLLQSFINDMEKLASVRFSILSNQNFKDCGCNIELCDGTNMNIHGVVLCLLGDVLASIVMGGFKEGVGFALRKCRACLATQEDIQTMVILYIIKGNVRRTNLLYYMYLVSHK